MQLSTRGRYAVMAMLDLARMSVQGTRTMPVALADIAQRQEISLSYLEQLFACLRRAGLVKSMRGPNGGYILAKPTNQTAISEIINAVNEPLEVTRCGVHRHKGDADAGCVKGKKCNSHSLWASLGSHIESFLKHVSLANVLEDRLPLFQTQVADQKPAAEPMKRVHVQLS